MRRILAAVAALALAALAATPARATAEYDYKRNERLVIDSGLAPNQQYAVRAGNSGNNFGFFLTLEPSHKVAAKLEGISPDKMLDTAPQALHAIWAPDSRHVAIVFRSNRHELSMWLYGVGRGGAELVSGPDLIDEIVKGKQLTLADYDFRVRLIELTWQDPQRFHLAEKWLYDAQYRGLAQAVGSYGKESPNDNYKELGDDGKPRWTFVDVAADADCEIAGNSYRVIAMKPGTFVPRE